MEKQKTRLTGVEETLLIPLVGRAEEWNKFEPIIMDEHAVKLIEKIDYDFSKFSGDWKSKVGCAIRARILDVQTRRFIEKNPNATIINIGAGLDTRFFRVDNGKINWYELDLPEPTETRKKFFQETERYKMIGKSVFDFSWFDDIKKKKSPILIIAEGTFMYFKENEVKQIFENLIRNFPGSEVLVETIPPFIVKMSKKHETLKKMKDSPVFKWGIKYPREIEKLNSKIKLLESVNIMDYRKDRWKWIGKIVKVIGKNKLGDNILRLRLNQKRIKGALEND